MRTKGILLLAVFSLLLWSGTGCRSSIGVREAPVKQWLSSPPTPPLAQVQTPITIAIVTSDRRPQYSPGLLPAALYIPILPYIWGDYQGIPLENCLTFPGQWGTKTEICADYVHVIAYMLSDALRRSGMVVHAAYVSDPRVLSQYELVMRLDFDDFGYAEGVFTYCLPPITGIPFIFWALGFPKGYVGAGGTFTWKLYEQSTRKRIASGVIEDGESSLLGFYYGGGGYPAAIAGIHRVLLPRIVNRILDDVEAAFVTKSEEYWRNLIQTHLNWRRQRAAR